MKMKEKIINKQIIQKILMIFLIAQPLLDLYFLYDENVVNFFGFSPSTIIRIVIIGIIAILFLIIMKKGKEFKLYLIYILLVILYVIFHHLNALNFTDYYNGYDFGYNLIDEIFYIIRMLMPLGLIIVSAHFKFEGKKIETIVSWLIFIICGSIIITNIFGISTGSYSKEIIKGNILCWFQTDRCNLNYMDLASKGLFLDPNRLSALLVLITPIMFYVMIKNPNIKNKVLILINMLGMYMLGTKVSTYGFIIIISLSFMLYIFFSFIKKELKYKHSLGFFFLLMITLCVTLLPVTPAINRTFVDNEVINDYNNNKDGELINNEEKMDEVNQQIKDKYNNESEGIAENESIEEILKKMSYEDKKEVLTTFVEENYESYHINPHFILNSYPYQYDPEFWYNIMTLPLEDRTNFRLVEEMMLKRVKEINDNKMDDYLGITFTRMGNIFDLERDFLSHYYTLGIIGLILFLSPYVIIVLICMIKILLSMKNNLNLKNGCYLMGIGITLFAAAFTGNVMDGLIVTLILGFFVGQLINNVFHVPEIDEKNE